MKPISVRFKCFGPYMAEQFVDFEELSNKGIFLFNSFFHQIGISVICVRKIDITDMVYDLSIDCFWNIPVTTSIARFHMEDRKF